MICCVCTCICVANKRECWLLCKVGESVDCVDVGQVSLSGCIFPQIFTQLAKPSRYKSCIYNLYL